jgi:trimethylamine--corrinoid protein Co-methyltransferase
MKPKLSILPVDLIDRILDEAFQLLQNPGFRLKDPEATQLLVAAGAKVKDGVAHIPEDLIRKSLASVPKKFDLFDRQGNPVVHYSEDEVQFDPGSCAVNVLDPITRVHRPSLSADLIRIVKVAEMLPQMAAQSTAVVCHDSPEGIGDLYRLYLVLQYSNKPVVTGAFTADGLKPMIDLLAADAGNSEKLREKPRAIFDVCPSPPLYWTDFAARNLIELARSGVPAEMVSMPLAGATAPVTLIGSVVQHAAECLAGITIHQLASPGAPIVWGGAPAIFDMRSGTAPLGAIETAMIVAAYTQVGKSFGLPTHGYMCASDSKIVDAQAGLESGMTALIGSLAGVNMISGAGMLDFLACMSVEKLVIDAEAIAMTQRMARGVSLPKDSLAISTFAQTGLAGEFLKLQETRQLFKEEQYLPTKVINRNSIRVWEQSGKQDAFERAHQRVGELIIEYRQPELPSNTLKEFEKVLSHANKK